MAGLIERLPVTRLAEHNPYHDPKTGKFTSKSGAAGVGAAGLSRAGKTRVRADGTVVTSNVYLAARVLSEGGKVELRSVRQVSTLIDKLARQASAAVAMGKSAPNINLCGVSIKGTNLFCAESKGIPRIEMPQLSGIPRPGSPAAALPRSDSGEVDAAGAFASWLRERGVRATAGRERADHLRASQGELVGAKVAGQTAAALAGKYDPGKKPIFVTRDNYILDGHHRWASMVALDSRDGRLGDSSMRVTRLSVDIVDALRLAREFSDVFGIAPKSGRVAESFGEALARTMVALLEKGGRGTFNEQDHPRHPKGSANGGQFAPKGAAGVGAAGHRAVSTAAAIAAQPTGLLVDDFARASGRAGTVDEQGRFHVTTTKKGRPNADAVAAIDGVDFEKAVQSMVDLIGEGRRHWSPVLFQGRVGFYWKRNQEAHDWAARFGVKPEQAGAVMALLSRQNEWGRNSVEAFGLLRAVAEDKPMTWTPKTRAQILELTKEMTGGPLDIAKFTDPETGRVYSLVGKTMRLSEMSPTMAAMLHKDVPHGSFGFDQAAAAIRVLRGTESIDSAVGGRKLRSFYMNIMRPDMPAYVTIDTHMIRAIYNDPTLPGIPPKGSPREARRVPNTFGNRARRRYFADIVTEAGRRTGLQPHGAQAVIWWAWRDRHGRAEDSVDRRDEAWQKKGRYRFETSPWFTEALAAALREAMGGDQTPEAMRAAEALAGLLPDEDRPDPYDDDPTAGLPDEAYRGWWEWAIENADEFDGGAGVEYARAGLARLARPAMATGQPGQFREALASVILQAWLDGGGMAGRP